MVPILFLDGPILESWRGVVRSRLNLLKGFNAFSRLSSCQLYRMILLDLYIIWNTSVYVEDSTSENRQTSNFEVWSLNFKVLGFCMNDFFLIFWSSQENIRTKHQYFTILSSTTKWMCCKYYLDTKQFYHQSTVKLSCI